MNCEQARQELVALMDKELDQDQAALVQDHLKTCPTCRELWQAHLRSESLLHRLPTTTVSTDFNLRFWQVFDKRQAAGWPRKFFPFGLSQRALRWSLGLACCCGLLLWLAVPRTTGEKPDAAQMLIAAHLDFFEDFELIQQLDLLEDLEVIESLEEP